MSCIVMSHGAHRNESHGRISVNAIKLLQLYVCACSHVIQQKVNSVGLYNCVWVSRNVPCHRDQRVMLVSICGRDSQWRL